MVHKVLSIKQPWASLISFGIKDIENRTWRTNYRGEIWIHASKSKVEWPLPLTDGMRKDLLKHGIIDDKGNLLIDAPTGCIIGSAEILDCVKEDNSVWKENGSYGFKLANMRAFDSPVCNVKGKLGIWEFDDGKEN